MDESSDVVFYRPFMAGQVIRLSKYSKPGDVLLHEARNNGWHGMPTHDDLFLVGEKHKGDKLITLLNGKEPTEYILSAWLECHFDLVTEI